MLGHEPLWRAPAPLAGLSTTLKRAFAHVAAWTGYLLHTVGSGCLGILCFHLCCSVSFDKYPLMSLFSICLRYLGFFCFFLRNNKTKRMLIRLKLNQYSLAPLTQMQKCQPTHINTQFSCQPCILQHLTHPCPTVFLCFHSPSSPPIILIENRSLYLICQFLDFQTHYDFKEKSPYCLKYQIFTRSVVFKLKSASRSSADLVTVQILTRRTVCGLGLIISS